MAVYRRHLEPAQEPNVTICYGFPCFPPSAPSPVPAPALPPTPAPAPALPVGLAPSPDVADNVFTYPPPLSVPPPPEYTGSSKHDLTRTLFVILGSVLATAAVVAYYALLRYRASRRRHRAAQVPTAAAEMQQGPFDDDLQQDLLEGGEGPEEPYHVWYIRTAGLDEPTIGAIAAYAYRRGEGVVEGSDCAVCLGEFHDGEMLRLLPKCSHAFHVPCVDTWLRSHVSCPLCRAPILAPPQPPAPPHSAVDLPVNPAPPSSYFPSSAAPPGSNPRRTGSSRRRHIIPEGAEDGGDAVAVVAPSAAQVAAGHHPVSSFSEEASNVWVPIDLGNGPSEDEGHIGPHAPAAAEEGCRAGLQQIRHRSVSMDPSALGVLLLRMGLTGKTTSEGNPSATKNGERRGNNCKVAAPSPAMERSMSSGGGATSVLLSMFSGRPPSGFIPP